MYYFFEKDSQFLCHFVAGFSIGLLQDRVSRLEHETRASQKWSQLAQDIASRHNASRQIRRLHSKYCPFYFLHKIRWLVNTITYRYIGTHYRHRSTLFFDIISPFSCLISKRTYTFFCTWKHYGENDHLHMEWVKVQALYFLVICCVFGVWFDGGIGCLGRVCNFFIKIQAYLISEDCLSIIWVEQS